MSRRLQWMLAIAPPFLLLILMVARGERALAHGRLVVLALEPLDPMDPLAGRYLALRESIQSAEPELLGAAGIPSRSGESVYVHLVAGEPFWTASHYAAAIPDGDIGVWLRGTLAPGRVEGLEIDFGLARYYIPHDATDPSRLTATDPGSLALAVRVPGDGRGVIEDLLVRGVGFAEWNASQRPVEER